MKKNPRYILALVLIDLAISWIAITFFPEKLVPFLLDQQVKRLTQSNDLLVDKNSITLFTVGTSSPLPGERAQTGTAVFVNGHFFMFDVGAGVVQK